MLGCRLIYSSRICKRLPMHIFTLRRMKGNVVKKVPTIVFNDNIITKQKMHSLYEPKSFLSEELRPHLETRKKLSKYIVDESHAKNYGNVLDAVYGSIHLNNIDILLSLSEKVKTVILSCCQKLRNVQLIDDMLDKNIININNNIAHSSLIMKTYGNTGNIEKSFNVFHNINKKKDTLYASMLYILVDYTTDDQAEIFFNTIPLEKCSPIVYRQLIQHMIVYYHRRNQSNKLKEFYPKYNMNTECIQYIMQYFSRNQCVQECKEFYDYCLDSNKYKNIIDKNTLHNIQKSLLLVYTKNGMINESTQLYNTIPLELQTIGIKEILLQGYCDHNYIKKAEDLYNTIDKPSLYMVTCMLHAYASGDIDEALLLYNKQSEEIKNNPAILGIMIKSYCEDNNMNDALLLYNKLNNDIEKQPLLHIMMKGYININNIEEAKKIFDNINPIIHTNHTYRYYRCTTLLNGYIKYEQLNNAELLFNNIMEDKTFSLKEQDVFTSIMIRGYSSISNEDNKDNINKAYKLYNDMKCGIQDKIISMTALVKGLCDIKEMKQAEELFATVLLSSPTLTINIKNTFVILIKTYCDNDNMDKAEIWFNLFQKKMNNIQHNAAYNALIYGYGSKKNMIKANELFNQMKSPDQITYTCMIKHYGYVGDMKNAINMFNKMSNELKYINPRATSNMIKTYAFASNMIEAEEVFNSIIKPSIYHYEKLIKGYYFIEKDIKRAKYWYNEMRNKLEKTSDTNKSFLQFVHTKPELERK